MSSELAYLDDSVVALRQVRKTLSNQGILIECYTDADELLARDSGPTLRAVLLDVDLGGSVDGPAVAAQLRAKQPTLEIAFFTAVDAKTRADELRALGPVFDKTSQLEEAVAWLRDRSPPTAEPR